MISRFSRSLWRLLPGGIAVLVTAALTQGGAIAPLEQLSYRWLFQSRGAGAWDDRIVLITIDDATLAELGQFPLPRQEYAALLAALTPAKPGAIAFNIVFTDPSPGDDAFAAAIAQSGIVVLAQAWDAQRRPLRPVPTLDQAAIASGHISQEVDSDGLARALMPQAANQLALGVLTAEVYSLTRQAVNLPDLDQPLWINWPGKIESLPQYAFVDVVQGRVAPAVFTDKIVLVGVTATGVGDLLFTPFDQNPPANGLHLHAAVVDNLLQGRYLRPVQSPGFWGLALVLIPGLSWLLVGQRFRWQCIATGVGIFGWVVLGLVLFHQSYWLPMGSPLVLIGLTGFSAVLSQRLRESLALQRLLEDLWQHYRQDMVLLAELDTSDPWRLELLGESVAKLALLADQLGRSQSTQTTIAQSVSVGLVAADTTGLVWFCNPLATGWLDVQLGDRLDSRLVPAWLSPDQWETLLQTVNQGIPATPTELQRDNLWFELRFTPLKHTPAPTLDIVASRQIGFLLLIEDITHRKAIEVQLQEKNQSLTVDVLQRTIALERTNLDLQKEIWERQQVQEELAYKALHDGLTGLPNRPSFMQQLNQVLEQPRQQPTSLFAVLFLDCDRFKMVNDSFGHLVGDELLKAIAERLRNCIARDDMVARFGGDEFTILLSKIRDPQDAINVAERIRLRLLEPFFIGDRQLFAGTSIGIVTYSPTYTNAEEILRDADIAMYRAKRGGLGYTLFEPEMHLQVRYSLNLEIELRQALQRQQFSVHYQPIFSLETNKILGFEALLRWQHPTYGNIPPSTFIPIAEETGLIIQIGEWVLREACHQLRTWQQEARLLSNAFISVNLSVRQFNEANLIQRIDAILEETGLAQNCLKLEIRKRGIRLGIDDFGTGYSSLSYLHHFPVDTLKIDRSFISRIMQGEKYLSIVQAINTLAQQLEMTVIAEGIENQAQLDQLKAIGCVLGQGYWFCAPTDRATLEAGHLSEGVGECEGGGV
jgi:diguanylate cyclase (GGDEF)-like protein